MGESAVYGVYRLLERIGNALGPVLAGVLVLNFGYRVSFVAQTVGLRTVWWKDAASFAVADDLSVQGATSGIDAVIR